MACQGRDSETCNADATSAGKALPGRLIAIHTTEAIRLTTGRPFPLAKKTPCFQGRGEISLFAPLAFNKQSGVSPIHSQKPTNESKRKKGLQDTTRERNERVTNRTPEDWKRANPPKRYTDAELLHKGRQAVAMRRVKQAKDNGTLVPATECEVCGDTCTTVAHHWKGYDFPFHLWWVCHFCNANIPVHDGSWTIQDARKHIIHKKFEEPLYYASLREKGSRECTVCGVWFKSFTGTIDFREDLFLCAYCSENISSR